MPQNWIDEVPPCPPKMDESGNKGMIAEIFSYHNPKERIKGVFIPKTMKIRIKKTDASAKLPTKAHATDAGFDLYACSRKYDIHGNAEYGTGVAMEIPEGYVGLVFPRSSIANKDLLLSNAVGVIDSGYRGEIKAKFKVLHSNVYDVGDRIAQIIIMPYPEVQFEEVEELSDSDRGTGGYGSTGK